MRMNPAKYVRAGFERGNLIVEISKDAFKDAETRKEATKELQQIIKTYFGTILAFVFSFASLLFMHSQHSSVLLLRY